MTDQKQREPKQPDPARNPFEAEFEAMPLDKKFASLFRMEAATISEAFAYVVNSPLKAVEKVGDVIADFGVKIENEVKKAARAAGDAAHQGPPPPPKPKGGPTKRGPKVPKG